MSKYLVISLFFFVLLDTACQSDKPFDHRSSYTPITAIHFTDTDLVNIPLRTENTITVQLSKEPTSLHPVLGNSYQRSIINQYLHRFLLTYDVEQTALTPDLLKALPKAATSNSNIFNYELRDSLFWDDGSPVTAADIYFTFLVNCCPLIANTHAKAYLEALNDILLDPTNPKKCSFKMKNASVRNLGFSTGFPILQRSYFDPKNSISSYRFSQWKQDLRTTPQYAALKAWAEDFNQGRYGHDPKYMNGLGTYQLQQWQAGQYLMLTKKTKLNQGNKTAPQQIIFKILSNPSAILTELRQQNTDVALNLPESVFTTLSKEDGTAAAYHFACLNNWAYYYCIFNTRPSASKRIPFFENLTTRKALALLTPIDTAIALLHLGKRVNGPVYTESKEYDTTLAAVSYNFSKATALLAAAGWKDTDGDGWRDKLIAGKKQAFSFELAYTPSSEDHKNLLLLIAEYYQKAGIKVNLVPVPAAVLTEKGCNHQFDMLFTGCSEDFLPQDFSELWHSQSWVQHEGNYSGFGTAETDALIDSINSLPDYTSRIKPVQHLQKCIQAQQPVIFLYRVKSYAMVTKRYKNVSLYSHRPYMRINNWVLQPL